MGVLSGKQAPLRDQAVMAGNVKAQADPGLIGAGDPQSHCLRKCVDTLTRNWLLFVPIPGSGTFLVRRMCQPCSRTRSLFHMREYRLRCLHWQEIGGIQLKTVGMVDAQKLVCASVLSRPISARFLQAHGPLR